MDRADLSRPPADAALLTAIVADGLADLPGGVVTMSAVVKRVMAQCPDAIGAAQIVEEVVKRAASTAWKSTSTDDDVRPIGLEKVVDRCQDQRDRHNNDGSEGAGSQLHSTTFRS
jgi:hypothetical protein